MFDSIADLAREALAKQQQSGEQRYVIGITGPPGAGKSTLVEALIRFCTRKSPQVAALGLPMDGFHLTNKALRAAGLETRKGAPETFDAHAFVEALKELVVRQDSALTWPTYSRQLHEPVADAIYIPADIRLIFVEGNYLLLDDAPWRQIRELLPTVWYVEADLATISERLRKRQLDGGLGPEDADRHVSHSDLANARRVFQTRDTATRIVRIGSSDPLLTGLTDPATGKPFFSTSNSTAH